MSIVTITLSWATAFLAAGPAHGASRLEEYGGQLRCNDDAVKAQVVRALAPGAKPPQANAIQAAPGKLSLDGPSLGVTVGKATSIVSQPGAAGGPSLMKLVRSGDGAAVDVLMCRYRRSSSKAWSSAGIADLVADGQLTKRMPAAVGTLGRAFALTEEPGKSEDSVLVLVASGVDGKAASFEVSVAAHGMRKKKQHGPAVAKDAGKRILAEASDKSWEQYTYGQKVIFPEAKDEVDGYDDKSFDCSYYVWLVYKHAGIDYEFTGTEGLSKLGGGEFVQVTTPRPGDLVVWRPELGSGGTSGHVGIVIDDKTFWDNSSSRSVKISEFEWKAYDVPRIYIRRKGL